MHSVADTLIALPGLRHISARELTATAPYWQLRCLAPGEALWEAGDPADSVAVLADGEIALEHGGVELGRVMPGEILGETATCLPMPPRSLTLRARVASRVLTLPASRLLSLRRQSSDVYQGLLDLSHHALVRRIRATDLHIARNAEGARPAPRRTAPSPMRRLLNLIRLTDAWGACPPLAPLLRQQPGLADASDALIEALSDVFQPEPLEEGQVLCLEGEPGDGAWLIAGGTVEVLRNVRGGKAELLAVLGEGALVGVNTLLSGGPRTASCVATSRGWVYRITPEACKRVLEGPHRTAWRESLLASLARQVQDVRATLDATVPTFPRAAPANDDAAFRDLLADCGYDGDTDPRALDQIRVRIDPARTRRMASRRR